MTESLNMMQAQASISQSQALPNMGKGQSMDEMRKTAKDFEAVFLGQMLKPMFEGLGAEGPFGGGPAEDMWRSLMVDEYGKSIAQSGGIGIADQVLAQMIKLQEVN